MAMEVKDYCRNLDAELTSWKAKLYDVIRQMDKMPTSAKQKSFEKINGLNIVMTELEERIHQLRTSCPTEWMPEKKEISNKLNMLGTRYDEASKMLFDYDFGG